MNQLVPTNTDFQILQTIARTASSSGLYTNSGNEQKIFLILLAAQELGIKPMLALNGGIWNIQGKIEISARLMNCMIRRAGHSISVKELNGKICILEGKRADNGDTCISQFTIEEASRAGLTNRDVWKKYTEDMLYARAMSRLARRLFSDVIGMAYVEGEIRDANTIEVSPEIATNSDSQQVVDHIEQSNEMIHTTPKMICKEQWEELKSLIAQCTPRANSHVWNQIHGMEIISDEDFYKMKEIDFINLRNACLGNIQKQKSLKKEEKNEANQP